MPFVESAGLSTAPTATQDNAYVNLWNTSASQRLRLREIGFTNTAATASKMAIKRTTARGTNTTTQAGAGQDSADGGIVGTLDLTWSVESTKTGNYLRRATLAAVIGAGLQWTWWNGSGLIVPVSAGLAFVVPTAAAGAAMEVWAVWEE
jgi:uncharacterized membrane protein